MFRIAGDYLDQKEKHVNQQSGDKKINIQRLRAICTAFGACIACILLAPGVQAAEFTSLGDLPGGDFGSTATDVSDDGTVVVGIGSNSEGSEAFRWTAETGMVGLGDFPGGFFRSRAWGVSADGSVVVGQGGIEGPSIEAFRWNSADGMVGLGDLCCGVVDSDAQGVSADGNVVVGLGTTASANMA